MPLAGFALHVLASILLINLNNVFTIIRIRTSLQSFFYLLLAAALPSLYGVIPGLLAGLCFLTAIYLLFGSYRQEKSSGALFNSFAFAGIASLFVPQSLLLIPLLWIGASSFQSLNLKSLFASLLGGEVRKNTKALLTAGVSALINSVLILGAGVSTGLSFLISLIAATIFGAMIYTDKEAGIE